jgi:uncharacterized repeat protein (TIGR03803 family)
MMRNISGRTSAVALTLATLFALTIIASQSAQAQTFNVIYAYAGHGTSAHAIGGLTLDRRGNLYGTTAWGGPYGAPGTLYELKRSGSSLVYSDLHNFGNGPDGNFPWDAPIFGPNGTLYGTTNGGGENGEGTVFNAQPPATICPSVSCPWDETSLYSFTRLSDGGNPQSGIIFDSQGNIYGSNVNGGAGYGVVYKMTPSGEGWNYQVIYTFTGGQDGANPEGQLLLDSSGNLYGTATTGGLSGCGNFGCGTIYKLSPSGSGWTETTLYSFRDGTDGAQPTGGLIADSAGNLYGATSGSDVSGGGTVYELTPNGANWTFNLLYDLPGNGPGPMENLARDSAGNLYAATWGDGAYGQGNVFKLTPTNNGWVFTTLHDFTGAADGSNALGALTIDSNGVVYGTTYDGGAADCACGVVFEVTP